MSQPKWKYVGNIGDATPLEYGGSFVLVDETGVYEPEMEVYLPDEGKRYRVVLERMAMTKHGLVHASLIEKRETLPHPIESYVEWYDKYLKDVAQYTGQKVKDLVKMLCSHDPIELARGYQDLISYHGAEEFGAEEWKISRFEASAKYRRLKA